MRALNQIVKAATLAAFALAGCSETSPLRFSAIRRSSDAEEVAPRPAVDIAILIAVKELGQPQNNADQVVRALLVVFRLHFRRNLVIRLGKHVFQLYLVRIVAERSKGENFCHN